MQEKAQLVSKDHRKRNETERHQKATPHYPQHRFRPQDILDFIELPVFSKRWEELGLDDEGDLGALQLFIMAGPRQGKVIKGTRSLRKIRFAPPRWATGTSGAARVLYVYYEEFRIVLLCLCYGKNEVDNISAAVAKYLNKLVREVEQELRRHLNRA